MSTYYDGDLEVGRFDLIHVDKAARPSVDVNLVLHVVSTDDEMFARKLVEGTVAMCGGATPHVRLKAYCLRRASTTQPRRSPCTDPASASTRHSPFLHTKSRTLTGALSTLRANKMGTASL
jgi:hypothetical protein